MKQQLHKPGVMKVKENKSDGATVTLEGELTGTVNDGDGLYLRFPQLNVVHSKIAIERSIMIMNAFVAMRRFLMIDDDVYLLGASVKDMGIAKAFR